MGVLLSIISIILSWILYPIGAIYSTIKLLITFKFRKFFNQIDKWFFSIAISVDQLGNVFMQHLLNDTLTKEDMFGNPDETISYVLGKAKHHGKLTKTGVFVCYILHLLDTNHVEKAYGTFNS